MSANDIVNNNKHIILFDGVCKLCSGWVQFVYQRDPQAKIKFASVQSDAGKELLAWSGLPANHNDNETFHYETMVYIEHGKPYFKSEAFFNVVRQLQKPWPILALGEGAPVLMRDWLYDRIARNRYRLFGKRDLCLMPSGALSKRFI